MNRRASQALIGISFGASLFATVLAPRAASAHASLTDPAPRDANEPDPNKRARKSGPCGGIARTSTPKTYKPGQKITVKWQETIQHQGCFQIAFSPANDANWVELMQINDPADNKIPMVFQADVTLPNTPTTTGTLVVRQLMFGKPCGAGAKPGDMGAGDTYFSCADVVLASDPAADAGSDSDASVEVDAGSTEDDGGTAGEGGVTGSDASVGDDDDDDGRNSGRPDLRSGAGDGCSVGAGGSSAASFGVLGGAVALCLGALRRRRTR